MASTDHHAGVVDVRCEQRELTFKSLHELLHRLRQVASLAHVAAEQQCSCLGVGLAQEGRPVSCELFAQCAEVLDDAVVDQCELAVVAEMRMRVLVGGATVRRPAGVADASA